MDKKSSILIIYTGGTIGMQRDASGTLVPFDFNSIEREFPSVRQLNVHIDVHKMTPIDSSNVTPALWSELARTIRDNYACYDGFVVLHGTDTMSYTASALSFMLENLAKPVVFTGSQIPMGIMRTDGRENLITAIEIAAAKIGDRPIVPEVSLYFQNRLFRANRTSKVSAEALSAFDSRNYPPLAEVGVNIAYNFDDIAYPEGWFDGAFEAEELRIAEHFDTNVAILKIFPGISEQTLRAVLSINGLRGVVLETFGTGNAPTTEWFIETLSDAIERGLTIVNVTQCTGGAVAMELYETGVRLQKIGVISGHDMTTEAAVTKLMWLLGETLSGEEVARRMIQPLRGEFHA
ncbi:MAG: asparaginase [Alistipes sp.]|jgi:L-asparaginase|nr:asparaginase [Alistipes sp.]